MSEEKKDLIKETKKLPRCVSVYNRLFSMITGGEFTEEKLPTEPELAKQMGVSRTTLRQALSLLQEDGMIKNIQGKGNFILKTDQKQKRGLEVLAHPVRSILTIPIEEMEIEFRLETGAEYSNKVLERKTAVVVYADIWYKYQGKGIAYTLAILPIETILEEEIDLSQEQELLTYLTEGIYQKSKYTQLHLMQSGFENFYEMKYEISEEKQVYLLQEALYSKNKYPIAYQKHYIPMKNAYITIVRKK